MKTGNGKVATGNSGRFTAAATTKILGCEEKYGGCPAEMHRGKVPVMVHIASQRIQIKIMMQSKFKI